MTRLRTSAGWFDPICCIDLATLILYSIFRGSNLLISADDNIENIQVVKVGELDNRKRGYAAFEFVPGTCDYMIVAIKSKEIEDSTESYITVFDINGNVLLDDQKLEGSLKFEGLYFVWMFMSLNNITEI